MSSDSDLARIETTSVPDRFEQQYMRGSGMVLFRDKIRTERRWLGSMAVMMVMTVAVMMYMGLSPLVAAATVPPILVYALFFSILRVTVSEGLVHVQYGLFGPRIPVAAIESADVVQLQWQSDEGSGRMVYRGGPHRMYRPFGQGDRAGRIIWHDDKGRRQVAIVGSHRAEELAGHIERARVMRLQTSSVPQPMVLPAAE